MNRHILVTGGTVFVSRYVAEYFISKGDTVYVLNRNTRPQPKGAILIEADRHKLGDVLKNYEFDVILDINAYTRQDVESLVNAVENIKQYIFISSSAVYPETMSQPFNEEYEVGYNSIWGDYGLNKYEAESFLTQNVRHAYIVRPPYLYGPMQNVYREPFVFDCAMEDRTFYIPKDGKMPLQFFSVEDLCRFIEILLNKQPKQHIFNVGNDEIVDIYEWVKLCYEAAGKEFRFVFVDKEHEQRSYFPFHDYTYSLDVSKQKELMPNLKPLYEGIKESYVWYQNHLNHINKKNYIEYINKYLS